MKKKKIDWKDEDTQVIALLLVLLFIFIEWLLLLVFTLVACAAPLDDTGKRYQNPAPEQASYGQPAEAGRIYVDNATEEEYGASSGRVNRPGSEVVPTGQPHPTSTPVPPSTAYPAPTNYPTPTEFIYP